MILSHLPLRSVLGLTERKRILIKSKLGLLIKINILVMTEIESSIKEQIQQITTRALELEAQRKMVYQLTSDSLITLIELDTFLWELDKLTKLEKLLNKTLSFPE
jgi:hypothetical protein